MVWLTKTQAAEKAQVTTRTIRNWIKRGHLKASKIGRLVRISECDLQAMLQAGRAVISSKPEGGQ